MFKTSAFTLNAKESRRERSRETATEFTAHETGKDESQELNAGFGARFGRNGPVYVSITLSNWNAGLSFSASIATL
ncbi:hypothetical protein, partial [Klebsiella pneumoniae]|uniref:hypothetical protein n=1 Tax=Klebsiella pneumoniae TaxID=573 RepID=UPI001D0E23BF